MGVVMAQEQLELVLKLRAGGNAQLVRRRMEEAGFTVMDMKSGYLLMGTRAQVEKVLSIRLEDFKPPADLPVPPDIADDIAGIALPVPRSYHR